MPTPWCRIVKTKLDHREIGLDERRYMRSMVTWACMAGYRAGYPEGLQAFTVTQQNLLEWIPSTEYYQEHWSHHMKRRGTKGPKKYHYQTLSHI